MKIDSSYMEFVDKCISDENRLKQIESGEINLVKEGQKRRAKEKRIAAKKEARGEGDKRGAAEIYLGNKLKKQREKRDTDEVRRRWVNGGWERKSSKKSKKKKKKMKKMKSKIHLSDDDDYRDVRDVRASEATEINENELKLIDEPMEKDNEKIKRPESEWIKRAKGLKNDSVKDKDKSPTPTSTFNPRVPPIKRKPPLKNGI